MADKNNSEKTARNSRWALFRPSAKWSIFSILCLGMLLALVGVIGFEASMKYSSTEDFCASSCHEMTANPYADWQNTIHYHNRSGVTADCASCHIPKPFIPKMIRKIEAAREVWGHITGIIDTPEKYAAHAPAMKAREVARLKANDSAECRNCHDADRMLIELQSREAQHYHQLMHSGNKTCIDCHQGIAHPTTGQPALDPGIGDAREVKPQRDVAGNDQEPSINNQEESATGASQ